MVKKSHSYDLSVDMSKEVENLDLKGTQKQESKFFGEVGENDFIDGKFLFYYRIVKILGTGSSSKVVLGINTRNNERVAIKIVPRNRSECEIDSENLNIAEHRIYREALISCLVNHPYIVRLKDFFYSRYYFFLIFEYIKGKQLYDVIVESGPLDEKKARRYLRQLLSAISFLHNNSTVHRDLKIENILIDENDNIKLIDFGLSNFYDQRTFLSTFCGSLYFAAPELLYGNRYCGPEIDIWSIGIILYVLLNGCVPFDDKDVTSLQNKIKDASFTFAVTLSSEAKSLIRRMINPDMNSRILLEQIIEDEWVNIGYPSKVNNYLIKRYPLDRINMKLLRTLSAVASFQFKNLGRDVIKFYNLCIEDENSLEKMYWSRRPVISLYYSLLENFDEDDILDSIDDIIYDECISEFVPEKINRFVSFVLHKEKTIPCSKYYKQDIFEEPEIKSDISISRIKDNNTCPRIKNTYIKGFFNGYKVKNVGTNNALKKVILDILNSLGIAFDANKKYYFCTMCKGENECIFKISLYYNIVLGEYYFNTTFLNGNKRFFKEIHAKMIDKLNMLVI